MTTYDQFDDDRTVTGQLVGVPGDFVVIVPAGDPAATYEGFIENVFVGAPHGMPFAVQIRVAYYDEEDSLQTIPWGQIESITRSVPKKEDLS